MAIPVTLVTFLTILFIYGEAASDKPCGKHNINIKYVRNCAGTESNDIVQIKNVTMELTDDCRLIPRGCYLMKRTVSDLKIDYTVFKKPSFKKKGSEDLCKAMDEPKFQKMASQYKNVDAKCPVKAGTYCIVRGHTVIEDLNPATLNMATGTIDATINIVSASAKIKSCVELEIEVSKKKG